VQNPPPPAAPRPSRVGDSGRNDRHPRLADREAAARSGKYVHHAGGGIEPERRAAGQYDRIDPFDQRRRAEQFRLAAARRAAANIDRGNGGSLGEHHRRPGKSGAVLGLTHQDAWDVGDPVARSRGGHRSFPGGRYSAAALRRGFGQRAATRGSTSSIRRRVCAMMSSSPFAAGRRMNFETPAAT